jgi:DNA-binding GntR family transcriptional regulator
MSNDNLVNISGIPERRSLAEDVVQSLRQAIWSGQLKPGLRLREEELAELLKVSRGPIREALTQLELEGLVIKQPNRGAAVARLSREDLDEVYSLRMALETLAIRLAIRNATPAQIQAMQGVVDEMAAALDQGMTKPKAADLDINFHEILYQAAAHKRLYEFWLMLRSQIYIFLLWRTVANADWRDLMLPGHQELVDLIKAKDEAQAQKCIEGHLQIAYERILRSYEDNQQPEQE